MFAFTFTTWISLHAWKAKNVEYHHKIYFPGIIVTTSAQQSQNPDTHQGQDFYLLLEILLCFYWSFILEGVYWEPYRRVADRLGKRGAGSLWLLFGHTAPHTALTSDRAWPREPRGGGFEVRPAYLRCMWTENRKTGALWGALKRKKQSECDIGPAFWQYVPNPVHVHNGVMRVVGLWQTQARWGEGSFLQLLCRGEH